MRTICGFTGDDDRNLLKKMTTHSGNQTYVDEGFSVSAPQIAVDTQGTVLAFNGAIYNKQERTSQTDGDAEAMLKLYRENGEKFIEKINGSFSLAVWDPENGLILGRDRNGEKNLYHCRCGGRLLFSSRIKQLYQHDELEKAVSLEGMTNFFAWGHIPTNHTLFKDIYKLPASSILVVKGNSHSTTRYWNLEIGNIDYSRTEDEWIKHIYSAIEDSIICRLETGPHGVLLGGVDSSAIAALLKKEDQDIKLFTVYFSEEKNNEPFAKRTADYLGLDHHEEIITSEQVITEFPHIIMALENPTADMNATIPTYFGYKLAKENDVKTIFTGDGADLAFWGNPPCARASVFI